MANTYISLLNVLQLLKEPNKMEEKATPFYLTDKQREKLKRISKKVFGKKNMNAGLRYLIEKEDE